MWDKLNHALACGEGAGEDLDEPLQRRPDHRPILANHRHRVMYISGTQRGRRLLS